MQFGKQHDTTDTTDFCPHQLVTGLLRICYGETHVMDFGLMPAAVQDYIRHHPVSAAISILATAYGE